MRQVPTPQPPVGIAGDGRLARHFTHYLTLLGTPTRSWSRRHGPPDPGEAFADCGTVLLLLRDDAIEEFVRVWPGLRHKRLVHCSGCLDTAVAESAHPLMTFGPELYELDAYRRIPFVLQAGGRSLAELLPSLPNRSFTIPAEDKPLYHALAVMAGNFSSVLWTRLFVELESRWGIPASAATPFLEQVTANLKTGYAGALTGPIVRRDTHTISANLAALEGDRFREIYRAFVRVYDEHR